MKVKVVRPGYFLGVATIIVLLTTNISIHYVWLGKLDATKGITLIAMLVDLVVLYREKPERQPQLASTSRDYKTIQKKIEIAFDKRLEKIPELPPINLLFNVSDMLSRLARPYYMERWLMENAKAKAVVVKETVLLVAAVKVGKA
ncbi:hypothetical protein HDU97_000465 [Phlyctochytrium planicorne]|nr:hypothetical protein HDU97_000465 [Phlyctochytrium planicorne]